MNPEKMHELQESLAKQEEEISSSMTPQAGAKLASMTALAGGPTKDTISVLLTEAANKGIMPKHALQLGDDTMEAIYSQGYNLYNQGRYKEASYIFRLLMLLDYMTPKYILGLAASLHRMKDYKTAANIYLLCGTLDTTNPLPHYHSADCYIQLGAPIMAMFSLGLAINAAGDQPQYAIVKERALLMKEALNKQLESEDAKAAGKVSKESDKVAKEPVKGAKEQEKGTNEPKKTAKQQQK